MAVRKQKVMGFVAFREGSQRLRLKNGALIGGKPLYQITLDKLVDMAGLGLVDVVVASTDSRGWAAHCRELYGDRVVLHERTEAVSGSHAGEGDVITEFLSQCPEFESYAVLLLLCTYPFMKPAVLARIVGTFSECGESVFAVVESHHMPQKLLRLDGDALQPYLFNSFDEFEPNTKVLKERYPVAFHSTGAFLLSDSGIFKAGKSVWEQDSIRFVVDDSFHVDIDTEHDLEMARLHFDSAKI